jgi:hypothetical protein
VRLNPEPEHAGGKDAGIEKWRNRLLRRGRVCEEHGERGPQARIEEPCEVHEDYDARC